MNSATQNIVELTKVSKSFEQGGRKIQILKDIDLTVSTGQSLAILGQSGSGKTTLLTLIAGLDQPDTGQVNVLGHNINQLSEDQTSKLRSHEMAIVFQQFHLFRHLTALENVLLPLEIAQSNGDHLAAAKAILDRVGLSHRLEHFPSQMSGGECQRLAIARALVIEPKLLLADEPSGNLDQDTGAQVMSLMFQLVKEKNLTLVLVTHNKDLALLCDHSFYLT